MARLLLRDLTPGTPYKIQLRAADGDSYSEWSRRFDLTVSIDSVAPDTPLWAASNDWVSDGDTFVATWVAVDPGLSQNTDLDHYELELSDGIKSSVVRTNNTSYTLSFEQNRIFFGTVRATVYARVRSVDHVGNASAWTSQKTAVNPPPSAPASITTTALLESIKVDWAPVADLDVIQYKLQVSTTSSSTGFTDIYNGSDVSYVFGTMQFLTDHWFRAYAIDKFGSLSSPTTSGAIRPKSSFTVDTTPPATPTALAATLTNNPIGIGAKAAVTWTMSSPPSDLAGFNIRYRPVGATVYSYMNGIDSADRAATVTLDQAYVNYEFQIEAYDFSTNYSGWSTTYTATSPSNAVPANVTGLTSVASSSAITYSWTGVADLDIKNYEVTFSTSPTFASGNITYLTGTSTTLTVGGLTANTTYYARVRAVDTAGNTSASWSATDTRTTGTNPAASTSDGVVPSTPGAPTVTPGPAGSLYVRWSPVTTNASAGPQNDPVTYEVHVSTTTGFSPTSGGATLATEVSGTSALIDTLPGTTTPLTYGTTYFVKLIAKDRDGVQATASSQGSAAPSKVASTDVTSIGADILIPGSAFITNLVMGTGGSIQSSNYSSLSAGWKISTTGIEMNDSGSKIKVDALQAGVLGGASGAGLIDIAAGTSLRLNGGRIYSNTYNGSGGSYDPNATAGFYLGNDGLVIAQGAVAAEAFSGGTVTAATINLSGSSAIIQTVGYNGTSGFRLSGNGLEIPDGSLAATKLNINVGNNLLDARWASLEGTVLPGTINSSSLSFDTTNFYRGTQAMRVVWSGASGTDRGFMFVPSTNPVPVEDGKTYFISFYARNNTTAARALSAGYINGAGTFSASGISMISGMNTIPTSTSGWVRIAAQLTVPAGTGSIRPYFTNQAASFDYTVDSFQIEEKLGASTPGPFVLSGSTDIDGAYIKTGSIQSTSNTGVGGAPLWSIPLNGSAVFQNLLVRGASVVGASGDAAASYIQSYNYNGTVGWKIDAAGNAFFASGTFKGTINATAGTFSGNITSSALISGGTFETSGTERVQVTSTSGLGTINFMAANAVAAYLQTYNLGGVGLMLGVSGGTGMPQILMKNDGLFQLQASNISFANSIDMSSNNINNVVKLNTGTGGYGTLDMTNGGILKLSSSSAYSVKWYNNSPTAIVFDGGKCIIAADTYNSTIVASSNTKALWAATVNGFAAYNNASDEREKKYITNIDIDDAYEKIKQVSMKRFQMRSGDGTWQYGFIAQEMENVLPEAVFTRDDNGHYMGIYQNLWSVGIAATQKLQILNEELQAKVSDLETRLAALEA